MELSLIILIGTIAILYSSIGHGGASGYMALMVLYGYSFDFIRPTALILNLLVSSISFYLFYRGGYFSKRLTLPFIMGSIPLAFIGGYVELTGTIYRVLLGVCLLIATLRIWIPLHSKDRTRQTSVYLIVGIGGAIGLVSGMIGIGGGIILSPVILLLGLADAKTTAATSAIFIWVNSLSGLLGFMVGGGVIAHQAFPILLVAGVCAFVGGFLGSVRWSQVIVQRVLAFVLLIASFKLLFL